jgi:hypothetical protein
MNGKSLVSRREGEEMGWEIHITRADHWPDSAARPITAEEWLALVAADPELAIDSRGNGPYFALWQAHWVDGDHPWFDWSEGAINTKNPDRKTLGKALQIGRHFGAAVQGDDGEVYWRVDDLPSDEEVQAVLRRPWWKFW